jgi:hypothetical protein
LAITYTALPDPTHPLYARSQDWAFGAFCQFARPDHDRAKGQECSCSTNGYSGHWYYVGSNRYLGVKFLIKGETHYGWVRMTVNAPGSTTGTITGYAYETIANKRVSAGESSGSADDTEAQDSTRGASLGILALGSGGLGGPTQH